MELKDNQVKKLLEYTGKIEIKQLAMNMALTRLKFLYKSSSDQNILSQCTREINALLKKFSAIMKDDYEWIIKL